MHPLEWVMVNMTLTFVGPVALGTHAVSTWAYYVFIFTKGVINHCGYHIPAPHVLSSSFHDAHHRLFNCNYGSYGLFDYLHGTIRK
ncbi:Oidioi.mRNA.OKI2018_I69.XSR.g16979.t1.cds [Oikopleura dioica]|uniref:Oidioi.mRNA.OKI2018_I69.XSR.g16979.t1.cds n=1 Tax=Oikopleura dioica TaxID=34765 RepID=A0ABN7SMX3_OIKDI|nr:Oidioi.mRNA.OKI2018_I69.XSR.g16979.t1.cds [Oikopleura dioica]